MAREQKILLRNWVLGSENELNNNELKELICDVVLAGDEKMAVYIREKFEHTFVEIASITNNEYMPIYSYVYNENGESGVYSFVAGKGEQIKATELEPLYSKAAGVWYDFKSIVAQGKAKAYRSNLSPMACGLSAGIGAAAGLAIEGTFKLAAKGVKLLMRDKEKYEKEMAFYNNALGVIDFAIGSSDSANIIEKIKEQSNSGNVTAQYVLGMAYISGKGVEKSKDMALKCFDIAAANGEKRSKNIVAQEFLFGEDEYTLEQKLRGIKYLEEFAESGEDWAMETLIDIYYIGSAERIGPDELKAFEYADRYSNKGNIYSKFVLAQICDSANTGFSDFKNDEKAAALYNEVLASNINSYSKLAAVNMGKMFKEGRGVAVNADNAVHCFEIGSKLGNSEAYRYLIEYFINDVEVDINILNSGCDFYINNNITDMIPLAYYCKFKIFDKGQKYKLSMDYAQKYIACENTEEAKKAELKKYIAEKEEKISKMTASEKREFLQEKRGFLGRLFGK